MQPYQLLEVKLAEWLNLDPAGMVVCSSGTAALHLAIEVLVPKKDSQVLVPDYGMIACPRAVTLANCMPVFIDCGDDLLINLRTVNDAPWDQRRASALMPVHIYGRRVDMDPLHRYVEGRDLVVIEDMAELHGISPHPSTHAAAWSFYANKHVAGEEGGAVYFKDPEFAEHARMLRSLGFTEEHNYIHIPRGHNYRLADTLAGLILGSLEWYSENLKRRRELEATYQEHCPAALRMPHRDAPWVYDLRIKGATYEVIDILVADLQKAGIAARHGFKPMSLQMEYANMQPPSKRTMWSEKGGISNAAKIAQEMLYLPLTPGKAHKETCQKAFEVISHVLETR